MGAQLAKIFFVLKKENKFISNQITKITPEHFIKKYNSILIVKYDNCKYENLLLKIGEQNFHLDIYMIDESFSVDNEKCAQRVIQKIINLYEKSVKIYKNKIDIIAFSNNIAYLLSKSVLELEDPNKKIYPSYFIKYYYNIHIVCFDSRLNKRLLHKVYENNIGESFNVKNGSSAIRVIQKIINEYSGNEKIDCIAITEKYAYIFKKYHPLQLN